MPATWHCLTTTDGVTPRQHFFGTGPVQRQQAVPMYFSLVCQKQRQLRWQTVNVCLEVAVCWLTHVQPRHCHRLLTGLCVAMLQPVCAQLRHAPHPVPQARGEDGRPFAGTPCLRSSMRAATRGGSDLHVLSLPEHCACAVLLPRVTYLECNKGFRRWSIAISGWRVSALRMTWLWHQRRGAPTR
jgi:hypothetical protein